jgi:hypothetical protein
MGARLDTIVRASLSFPEWRWSARPAAQLQHVPTDCELVMKSSLFVLMIGLTLTGAGASANDKAGDKAGASEQTIRREFDPSKAGRGLLVRKRAKTTSVEVCFDQCDYFEWTGSARNEGAWDFIALYVAKEGYGSNADSYHATSGELFRTLVKRYDAFCKGDGTFTCDWSKFAEQERMKVGIASYDEGKRCFAWRNLTTMEPPNSSKCAPITRSPWK